MNEANDVSAHNIFEWIKQRITNRIPIDFCTNEINSLELIPFDILIHLNANWYFQRENRISLHLTSEISFKDLPFQLPSLWFSLKQTLITYVTQKSAFFCIPKFIVQMHPMPDDAEPEITLLPHANSLHIKCHLSKPPLRLYTNRSVLNYLLLSKCFG